MRLTIKSSVINYSHISSRFTKQTPSVLTIEEFGQVAGDGQSTFGDVIPHLSNKGCLIKRPVIDLPGANLVPTNPRYVRSMALLENISREWLFLTQNSRCSMNFFENDADVN